MYRSHIRTSTERKLKHVQCLSRSPVPEDWARVYVNSHRVRALRLQINGPTDRFHVSEDIYQLFTNHCPVSHITLFPNLRGISCSVTNNAVWGTATAHLLAEGLARTHPLDWFDYVADDSNTIDLVECLRASSLKTFYMGCSPSFPGDSIEGLRKAVVQLRTLENAEFGDLVTSTILSRLATLPKLTSLVLCFDPSSTFQEPQLLRPGRNNFVALRDLRVTVRLGGVLAPLIAFFNNIVPDRLRNLTVRFVWLPIVDDLTELIHSIGRVGSLRTLDIHCSMRGAYRGDYVPARGDEQRWPLPCATLSPLLRLRALETLKIDALPLVVQPRDIATFAAAWSGLKVFRLSPDDVLTKTTVHLSELLPLITGCPRLEELEIQLSEGGDPIAQSTTAPNMRRVSVALYPPFPDDPDSDSGHEHVSEEWLAWKRGWLRRLGAVFPHAEVETDIVAVGPFWL